MTGTDRVEHPISAGGVVYRSAGEDLEVVVCGQHVQSGWRWALPKGTPNSGETLEQTALREVTEETGLKVKLGPRIGSIQYRFVRASDGVRCHKTVHFYLMTPTGGSFTDHDTEFDAVEWCASKTALENLAYRNEIDIVEKALALLQDNNHGREETGQEGLRR